VAVGSKAWLCGRLNPAGGADVFLLWVVCVVR
jgi:hypothetical protein